jgi:hypothetical protein
MLYIIIVDLVKEKAFLKRTSLIKFENLPFETEEKTTRKKKRKLQINLN